MSPEFDLDLEDSNPIVLHDTPIHDDAPQHQMSSGSEDPNKAQTHGQAGARTHTHTHTVIPIYLSNFVRGGMMIKTARITYLKLGKGNHPGRSQASWVKPPSRSMYKWAKLSSNLARISFPVGYDTYILQVHVLLNGSQKLK